MPCVQAGVADAAERIFVGGLPRTITDVELKEIFSAASTAWQLGEVASVSLQTKRGEEEEGLIASHLFYKGSIDER